MAGVLALTTPYTALASPWSNASGMNAAFRWENGHNNTDLFGDPVVDDGVMRAAPGFFFDAPVNFLATLGSGAADFAQVTVTSLSLGPIEQVIVREWGTWSVSGGEDPYTAFTVQADVTVTQFLPNTGITQYDIDNELLVYEPDGTWYAEGTLVPAPGPWTFGWIRVTNTLQVAVAGASIEKAGMSIVIPEPASVWLLAMGFGTLAIRRSRA